MRQGKETVNMTTLFTTVNIYWILVRRQRELVAYAYMANRCPLQEEGRQKGTSSGRINEENPPLW